MRVLVVTNLFPPEFLGGYELGCAQMSGALAGRGHDVLVLTSGAPGAGDRGAVEVRRALDLAPVHNIARMLASPPALIDRFHQLSTVVNPANVRVLAETIEEFQPDVLYAWNLMGLGGLGLLGLLRQLGVPSTWHLMDMIPRLLCGLGGDAIPEIARHFGELGADRYLVCSSRVASENERHVSLGEHVHLLPNWVADVPAEVPRSYFSGGHLKLVSAVGELGEHKGIDILIEAAALLHEEGYANFSLDIFGKERDMRFRRMVHELGLDAAVHLKGSRAQAELLATYPLYDAFVFPTWPREPFAFAPLEAAAYGCLPVFSADCGNAEWMVGGVHCLKAERTPQAFAEQLREVLTGAIDVAAIARRARSLVTSDFHVSTVAESVERVLELCSMEARPPRGEARSYLRLMGLLDGLLPTLVAEGHRG